MLICSLETPNTCSCKKTDAYLYTHTKTAKVDTYGHSACYSTRLKHYGVIYIPNAGVALQVTPQEFDEDDNVKKWKGSILDSNTLLQFFNKIEMDLSQKTHTLVAADLAKKINALKTRDDPLIQNLADMFFKYHCNKED